MSKAATQDLFIKKAKKGKLMKDWLKRLINEKWRVRDEQAKFQSTPKG